jgi:hypothetical protein
MSNDEGQLSDFSTDRSGSFAEIGVRETTAAAPSANDFQSARVAVQLWTKSA